MKANLENFISDTLVAIAQKIESGEVITSKFDKDLDIEYSGVRGYAINGSTRKLEFKIPTGIVEIKIKSSVRKPDWLPKLSEYVE